jgi:hypothetical protein
MRIESTITYLLIFAICSFLIRWILNWIILNRINNTKLSPLRTNSVDEFIPMIKHIAISEWKIWWKGDDLENLSFIQTYYLVYFIFRLGLFA